MMTGKKTYNIITFGCQMNEHDSETISGMLQQRGYMEVPDKKDSDITIINTCSVRENADKRFFGTLGQLKKIKEKNPDYVACVCGCMMQQEHIVTEVKEKYPWVDIIFGTHNIYEFPDMLDEVYDKRAKAATSAGNIRRNRLRVARIYEDSNKITEGLPAKRLYRHKSFVNIMFGCNNFCTYCIVPYTRGREKSRRPEDILEEIRNLADDGVKEVTLLGQNVNSYKGSAANGRSWNFTDLIYSINEIDGVERIRFMTSHPKDLSDELIEAFAKCDKLCNYIHLPVQAGSNRVLKRMNRHYTREQYLELVRKLRESSPDIAISTDIIVGFPGETEDDFDDTLSLVKEVEYDSAFTFLYSVRKGTPAADFQDQIPELDKHRRFNKLVDIMNEISASKNAAYKGRIEEVLVDGRSKKNENTFTGRTDTFKLVDFAADRSAGYDSISDSIEEAAGSGSAIGSAADYARTHGEANGRADVNVYDVAGSACEISDKKGRKADADLTGKIVRVKITDAGTFSLKGRLTDK